MKYIMLMIVFSSIALAKDESPNKMTCEKVHGDNTLSGRPDLVRCENKKEVCFSHHNGLSCYPKTKE